MPKKNALMEAVGKIVEVLEPLEQGERERAIRLVLTYFGKAPKEDENAEQNGGGGEQIDTLNPAARQWLKQNQISTAELEQAFAEADGAVSIIGEVMGKKKTEKTLNAYVLEGVRCLLSTGKPNFDDQSARSFCESSGCYDGANHAKTLKGKGNWFTGTKEKGWILTAPGLKHGAALVKGLNKKAE